MEENDKKQTVQDEKCVYLNKRIRSCVIDCVLTSYRVYCSNFVLIVTSHEFCTHFYADLTSKKEYYDKVYNS